MEADKLKPIEKLHTIKIFFFYEPKENQNKNDRPLGLRWFINKD